MSILIFVWEKETTTYHFYNQLFLKYGVEIIPDTEAATTDQVLPLVKSELGLAFLPEEMTEEARQSMRSFRSG